MAIKVALAAALLAALVALSAATSYTTTITTTSVDEEGSQNQQCRMMVQLPSHFCQTYLQQSGDTQAQQQFLEKCCVLLKQLESQNCGCEGIRQAVIQAQMGGSRQQILRRARDLPRRCNLSQQQCRLNVVFV